ncbi:dickkopf-related protein 4-like [Pelobates fuscus]|uniref:dickkopf-related protein 4-like n=1 Tax=Pelobates fuscus TaxID=191477 RepID=UPI002FE4A9E2
MLVLVGLAVVLMLNSVSSLPAGYHNLTDGASEEHRKETAIHQTCNSSSDCLENQYCHSTDYTTECQECKPKERECEQDDECCFGHTCIWRRCTEVDSSDEIGRSIGDNETNTGDNEMGNGDNETGAGDTGTSIGGNETSDGDNETGVGDNWTSNDENETRCGTGKDPCAPGFCCSRTEMSQFPVCIPFPAEGDQCGNQLINFFGEGSAFGPLSGYCTCTEGLVCTSKGLFLSPTCEKPDDVLDFTAYRSEHILQTLAPWTVKYDNLAMGLPKAAVESGREAENAFNMLGDVRVGSLESEKNMQFEEHVNEPSEPSQVEFQELKQLAKHMGQFLGPGFY